MSSPGYFDTASLGQFCVESGFAAVEPLAFSELRVVFEFREVVGGIMQSDDARDPGRKGALAGLSLVLVVLAEQTTLDDESPFWIAARRGP